MGEGSTHSTKSIISRNTSSCRNLNYIQNTDKLGVELDASYIILPIITATTSASTIRKRTIAFAVNRILKHDLTSLLLQLSFRIILSMALLAPRLIWASSQWIRRLVPECVQNVPRQGNKSSWSVLQPGTSVQRTFRYSKLPFHVLLYFLCIATCGFGKGRGNPSQIYFCGKMEKLAAPSSTSGPTGQPGAPNAQHHASQGANLVTSNPVGSTATAAPPAESVRPTARADKK